MKIITNEISISIQPAKTKDGPAVHRLVKASPPLDVNSRYCYLLLCSQFNRLCLTARAGQKLAGFVSAYRHPLKEDTIFVWQIAVDEDFRRRGVAGALLEALIRRALREGLSYIETTVTPSNRASLALFEGLAAAYVAECRISEYFSVQLLGDGHEEEVLLRIGPLKKGNK